MKNNYRFYSFVAGLYLSPIQCGIQTAHAVSEMSVRYSNLALKDVYKEWAEQDKVLIVCQAVNHAGVVAAYEQLQMFEKLGMPIVIFYEDEQSMNGMATAAGIIVPERYYNATYMNGTSVDVLDPDTPKTPYYVHLYDENYRDRRTVYPEGTTEFEFINFLKSFRLA